MYYMNRPEANEYVQQLWTSLDADGDLACDNVQPRVTQTAVVPCQLIRGHGEVVVMPVDHFNRLVWLLSHTPELTAEQNAEVERIIASVNGGE
jgi:hypothetical protein